jgi:phosphate transport system permease protein
MLLRRSRIEWKEELVRGGLFLCAILSIATTFGIIAVLTMESFSFFSTVPVFDFLFGTRWTPLLEPRSSGGLPLV